MSLFEDLKPTKEVKTYEITTFSEDMDIFMAVPEYLEKKNKGQGKFTQEVVFEHLIQQLKEDKDLMSFAKKRRKKSSVKEVTK